MRLLSAKSAATYSHFGSTKNSGSTKNAQLAPNARTCAALKEARLLLDEHHARFARNAIRPQTSWLAISTQSLLLLLFTANIF